MVFNILLVCAEVKHTEQKEKSLNVVLIFADDQGGHLSSMRIKGISTPYIDALAKKGMQFNNTFVVVPSYSPSRSSINTGMYPHANGHWTSTISQKLSDSELQFGKAPTKLYKIHKYIQILPEILNDVGYYTGITQKFHMSPPWKFPYNSKNPVYNNPEKYKQYISKFIKEAEGKLSFIQANIIPPPRNLMSNKSYLLPADLLVKIGWGNDSYQATLDAKDSNPNSIQFNKTNRILAI